MTDRILEEQSDRLEEIDDGDVKQIIPIDKDREEQLMDIVEAGEEDNTPNNTLLQNTILYIRRIHDDELIDFTVRNFSKKIRDGLIIRDRRDRIPDIDDWSRMVFLANRGMDRLPRGDNEYSAFKSEVKSK